MSRRFARNGWPRAAEIIPAVTFTANATPHDEGAYSEIDASAAQDVCCIDFRTTASVGQTGIDTSMLFTLAIGAAASEVDVVKNVALGGTASNLRASWPLHIPAGSRIAGKLRAEQVSDTCALELVLLFGGRMPGWGGYFVCESLGAVTANSTGTPISNTAGTYTEIAASTASPIRAVSMSFGLVDNSAAAATQQVDLAVGAAGSELIIGSWLVTTTAVEEISSSLTGPRWLERSIAAGSRIAVKKDGTADLACVVHGWR